MALILIVGVKEGLAHMLAALVQVDDGVNLKIFFRLSISKVLLEH